MNSPSPPPSAPQPNTLGKASLVLGILAIVFVFGIGVCAGVGKQQGWLPLIGVLLFIVGVTFSFVGLLAAVLGFLGLFGRNRSRAAALVGLLLGIATIGLFAAIMNAVK